MTISLTLILLAYHASVNLQAFVGASGGWDPTSF
jgi:hypothetical protein